MSIDWQSFRRACSKQFKHDQLIDDYARRFSYGTDASFYRLVPKLVVKIADEKQLRNLFRLAQTYNVPLTLRAAGTSLSGQAVTDSVLVMLESNWNQMEVLTNGSQISLQPGVIGADAHNASALVNRKIGPDPASINTCEIGGIVANNASGMCCGTAHNSYQTLAGIRVILADGGILDTRDPASVASFQQTHQPLLTELEALGRLTKNNSKLAEKIQHKYSIKNTTGYSLNALIDYQDPVDILSHLMVGSEGTLGFISEVTLDTVQEDPCRAVSLVLFRNMDQCCLAVAKMKNSPASAVELIDSRSLAAVAGQAGMPWNNKQVADLGNDAAALLVETRADSTKQLEQNIDQLLAVLEPFETAVMPVFSKEPLVIDELWAIRKGLFPSVGAIRKTGTTVIIEDVAFPVIRLAMAVRDLQKLLTDYGYHEALIFGHGLEGNLHFVFAQAFDSKQECERYSGFMDAVCHLVVVEYQGSLKAEHGTGRNIAPYVELEWGKDAYALMWQIKQLFDPQGVLNPGVILNEDPAIHLKNLKVMPAAHPLVDKCIECGFCEPVCPSRNLTLTPRQRIALYRNIYQKSRDGESPEMLKKLLDDFTYLGVDTCAATGLCEDRCPVGINTGELIKLIRQENNARHTWSANLIGRHFGEATQILRFGLGAADISHRLLSTSAMSSVTNRLRRISGDCILLWTPAMPRPCKPRKLKNYRCGNQGNQGDELIYWPSCAARNFSPPRGSDQAALPDIVLRLLEKAGYKVKLAFDQSLCCGQPFESKGHFDTAEYKRLELQDHLLDLSDGGNIPIVADTSPCILKLQDSDSLLKVFDPILFSLEHLSRRLQLKPVLEKVALHITCSTRKMGLVRQAEQLAKRCAEQVVIPTNIECCGFAGDKGFTVPELNASALSTLKEQISGCSHGYSTSLTCEIGLTQHTDIPYSSILYLVDQACL